MKKQDRTGVYRIYKNGGESYKAYIPPVLPFSPPLNMDNIQGLLEKAGTAVGRLDGMADILPDISIFLYSYVRKEALLSSQIEGTQSTLSDLLLFELEEAPGIAMDDVKEVSNYVAAINHGIRRIREDNFPLSLRLLKEIHYILLSKGRGDDKSPGDFRKSQNWFGGTRPGNALFVPPPLEELMGCLDNFEKFLYLNQMKMPTLIKAAIAHLQFESIHPFLDGNGRLGRLLITLLLCSEGILKEPILYLSLYFKTHKKYYYELLQSTRETGDWEKWVSFFLEGIISTANEAVSTARKILALYESDKAKINALGNNISSLLKVFDFAFERSYLTSTVIVNELNLSMPTAVKSLKKLVEIGILKEITGKQRHQVFAYTDYVNILNQDI